MVMKLMYFDAAARAEASRMILDYGKVPYENVIVGRDDWAALKPKTPQGQMPVLQLDNGTMIAQSGAIERYVAKLAGLYPKDPIDAAFADQACFLISDTFAHLAPTFALPDGPEKIAARQALMAGKIKDGLNLFIKTVGEGPYVLGKQVSYADFVAFSVLSGLKTGNLDGIPKDSLDAFPALEAYLQRIASLDAMKARYASATGTRVVYQAK